MLPLKRQSLLASLLSIVILLLVLLIQFNTQLPHSNPNLSLITTTPNDEKNHLTLPNPHKELIMTLLVGIFTRPEKYDRRNLLRLIYNNDIQSSPTTFTIAGGAPETGQGPALTTVRIDLKFIMCNLSDHDRRKIGAIVALEILRFRDIVLLNCTENMNTGKTHTYFSSLPGILPRYDYVMKADDDTYLRLERLAASLERAPRDDLYYGFVIPCPSMNPFVGYMSGMGYVLSWDLVEWIGRSGIPANNTRGPEDKLVGQWLDAGKRGKNRVNNKPAMYDYPGSNGKCSHRLIPDTIAVHRLKKVEQWVHVLTFFNVTPPPL